MFPTFLTVYVFAHSPAISATGAIKFFFIAPLIKRRHDWRQMPITFLWRQSCFFTARLPMKEGPVHFMYFALPILMSLAIPLAIITSTTFYSTIKKVNTIQQGVLWICMNSTNSQNCFMFCQILIFESRVKGSRTEYTLISSPIRENPQTYVVLTRNAQGFVIWRMQTATSSSQW